MRLDVAVESHTAITAKCASMRLLDHIIVNVASPDERLERADMELDCEDLLLAFCPPPHYVLSPPALPSYSITNAVNDATSSQAPFVTSQPLWLAVARAMTTQHPPPPLKM